MTAFPRPSPNRSTTSRATINRWAAVGVVFALVVPLVVLALRSDGFHATKVNLNDAGIWVVNWGDGVAGRINTQTASIEVAVPAPAPPFDIAQADDVVLLNVPGDRTMVPVDVALARLGDAVEVPDDGAAQLGGTVGAVSDPSSGKVWTAPRARLAQVNTTTAAPILEAGAGAVTVVGLDGTAYAYAPRSSEVHVARLDVEPTTESVPPIDGEPAITVVGDQVVLLDPAAKRVIVPGRAPIELGDRGDRPVLQLPGPVRDEVLVGTDDALLAVSLESGEVREVVGDGSGSAVAPVWLDGCAFGAWMETPRYAQVCEGRDVRTADIAKARPGGPMQFRVNRNRVVLNDTSTGLNLLFTDDDPLEVDNWDDALNKDRKDEVTEQEVVAQEKVSCGVDEAPTELVDDRAGTRPGRPVIVPVLGNDKIPRCEVPIVAVPTPPDPSVARVDVVDAGTAIQVTPAADRTAPVTFAYEVVTTTGGAKRATVTVDIATADVNSAPVAEPDTTSVVAGRTVRHDVLGNDHDPEGDALTLIGAVAADGSVSFRSGGEIAYTASGSAIGTKVVNYTIEDDRGATAEGVLEVNVTAPDANVPPTARNDRLTAVAGREATVSLLANDSDPNTDPLQVTAVDAPADLDVTWDDEGLLRVIPDRAGTWLFTYAITDGEDTADAQVRVDATEEGVNRPPVAVRDDLAVRPAVAGYLDLVANDIDADGDLLAVIGVDVPVASGLTVELLDKHIVRVTAPPGFAEVVPVPYTVSDGASAATGILLVRPFRSSGPDQPPIVGADEVSIRAGSIAGISVLENDLDPEGERLTLTEVAPLGEGEGQIFVQADQLRYAAPATGPATVRVSYTVEDPGGNRADGAVTIRVLAPDHPNQPPRPPRLEARVFAGDEIVIPVPVMGIDPDGDQVFVVAVSEPPQKGHAVPVAGGFSYRADRGASGPDSFSFLVRDSQGAEATGVVRIAIVGRPTSNSNPVAVPDRKNVEAGSSVPIAVLANDSDPDGDELALLVDGKDAPTTPRIGSVRVDPEGTGLIFDAPTDAGAGDVSFSYGIADGRGGSARGIVTITIETGDVANRPPIARDDAAALQNPGSTVEVDVLANDLDPDGEGEPLQVAVVTPGIDATVTGSGAIQVKVGERSVRFVYEVTDEGGATAQAVVSVPVLEQRPPVCETRTVDVRAGDSVTVPVLDGCVDPGGGDLELVRVLAERGGTVRLDGSNAVFTAAAEVLGDAGFAFLVSNGTTTGYGGVIVRVTGQDFPPTFVGTAIDLPAGGSRSVELTALVSDLNSEDTHTFTDLQGASPKVQATLQGSVLRVQAADDAKGESLSLRLTISDGTNPVQGEVRVRVLPHDGQPPAAVDDLAETFQDKPVEIDVTANDVDPIGGGLTVSVRGATGGEAVPVDDRRIRFTPTAGFAGEATITYEIADATNDSQRQSSATVRVSVIGFPLPPPAPTGVRDSELVRLTWGAAQPNGSPITEYVVESDAAGTRSSASNALVFDGLTNGTPYRFRVAAKNRAVERDDQLRWSDWSPPLIPDTVPGVPEAPRLAFGDRSIRVAWTPPSNEGTAITNFQVRISGQNANETRDLGTATQTDWTGLVNGQSYAFSVRALNDAGNSEWSALTNDPVNSIPATVPGPPPDVAADRLDKDTTLGGWVNVRWGTPLDNGDANFTFVVSVSPADVAPITIANAAARNVEIGGLRNGVSYTFTVMARNKAGDGSPASSSPTVPAARPDPVSSVAGRPDDGQARLTVTDGANNGAAIDSYQVSANGGPFNPMNVNPNGVGVVPARNGDTFTFQVRACNVVGCSDPSAPSNPVTPFGPPRVTSSVNGSVITWSWNDQPGVDSYSVSGANGTRVDRTTYRVDLGPGPARNATITVTGDGQGVQQSNTDTARTQATTTVTINFGASAAGEITSDGELCSSACRWIDIHLRGFAPNSNVVVECQGSRNNDQVYSTQIVQVDGNGNRDLVYPGYRTCFWGRNPGTTWVNANGIRSNDLSS